VRGGGRYALHSHPPEEVDDEFCVTGRATEALDPGLRAEVARAYHDEVGARARRPYVKAWVYRDPLPLVPPTPNP
jgi:hypothetical protein